MDKDKFDKNWLVLVALAIVFVFVYSWFSFTTSLPLNSSEESFVPIFSWPDAMANNFFVDNFLQKNNFIFSEPLNLLVNNIIHPRSTNVLSNGDIVPTAFLGFVIIHGMVGKLMGAWLIKFLTAFIASIAVLFFYALIKKIFNITVGLLSSLLLFSVASYWYYANLVMLPAVIFVFLATAGFYFLSVSGRNVWLALLSGIFLGLASIVRLTEIVWILSTVMIVAFFFRDKINIKNAFLFALGFIAPIQLFLYYNNQTYGSPWLLGYFQMNGGLGLMARLPTEMQVNAVGPAWIGYLKLIFLPFGFSAKHIVLNFYRYFVYFLWPYVALFIAGALAWLIMAARRTPDQRRHDIKKREQIVYAVCSLMICLWLVFYYGSWEFSDKMVLKNNLIASSYVRYWLAMNILILPFIALFFEKILKLKLGHKTLKIVLVAILFAGLVLFSYDKVYLSKGEGLLDQRKIINQAYELQRKVVSLIGIESILISDRADKLFWPKIKVVDFNLNYAIFPELKKIIDSYPVYYLSFRTDEDMRFINDKELKALGLIFALNSVVSDEYKLYRLVKTN